MYHIDDIVNTVIHGDSYIELKKIPDESVDCIIIDPPYRYLKHKLDRPFNEALIFNELYRILKPNSFLVIFGIGSRLCRDIVMLEDIGFKCKEECIWVKQNAPNFINNFPRIHESFYVLSKGKKEINNSYVSFIKQCILKEDIVKIENYINKLVSLLLSKENIDILYGYLYNNKLIFNSKGKLHSISDKDISYIHPVIKVFNVINKGFKENSLFYENWDIDKNHETQKPLELMSRIVKLVSNENDIILDCFAGSGSTLLGAIKNDRRYIGIEIDNEYYNVCINRIKEKQGLFYGKDI